MTPPGDLTNLGYRRIVQLLITLVIVPSVLLTAIGVLLLSVGEAQYNLIMGILVLTFCGTLATGAVLVWVFLRRERNLSQLQADFVSKVSHELRTPLTSIRMFTETLQLRHGDPESEQKCIDALARESTRLQELIDRLLDWGRMESGRRVYEFGEYPLSSIVLDAISAFEPTRERRDVDLQINVSDKNIMVWCDKGSVIDCVVNLLSNAYKYGGTPRKIDIFTRNNDKQIEISVHDNGTGIAPSEHRRIFEKFYRVDDRLARKQQGSGLGLAIVQHVMHAHGGRVVLESERGKGSTFTLILPIIPINKRKAFVGAEDVW